MPRPRSSSAEAPASKQLETLRKFRNRPARDLSLTSDLDRVRKELVRVQNAAGGLDAAWNELIPPHLAPHATVVKLSPGGVLTVRASDSGAAYEIDQWLRAGGFAQLRQRRGSLRRVKIEV
jgi:hypothetical protein